MDHFLADHKEYSRGLLSFTMGYIIAETWPDNSLMADFNECVERCDIGDTNCGCTCTTDPYVWPDEAVSPFFVISRHLLAFSLSKTISLGNKIQ